METRPIKFCTLLIFNALIFVFAGNCQNPLYHDKPRKVVNELDSTFNEQLLRSKMKEDGLTDPVIDKLVEQHKRMLKSGMNVSWTRVSRVDNASSGCCACTTMGGENGWGTYKGAVGSNAGGNPPIWGPSGAPMAPNFNLNTGPGNDPCTPGLNPGDPPIPVVAPGFGTTSIELGEIQTAGSVTEQLTYPLTVTVEDTNFIYTYALVLEDAPHQNGERPYAEFVILDPKGDTVPCAYFHYEGADASGTALAGFYNGSCDAHYKPWTIVGVDLAGYIGQTVTVVITNADCIWGGHFAQSYWDFSCGAIAGTSSDFCPGQADTLVAPADPLINYTYLWSPGAKTTQKVVVYPQDGDTISLRVKSPDGCSFSLLFTPQRIRITPGFTSVSNCGNVNFTDSSYTSNPQITITKWQWSFPGGTPSSSSLQNPENIFYKNGTYDVTLTVYTQGECVGTIKKTIVAGGAPVADFCVTPFESSIDNPIFHFCDNSSSDVVKWYWDFGDGSPVDSENATPVHSYSSFVTRNDFYAIPVKLTVQNKYECRDTVSHKVNIIPDFSFFMPDCFTPKRSSPNDLFYGKGRGIEDYTIWIYDRWGNIIWTCHNEGANAGWDNYGEDGIPAGCKWDGTLAGAGANTEVANGVYIWKVELRNAFNQDLTYLGRVTVLR